VSFKPLHVLLGKTNVECARATSGWVFSVSDCCISMVVSAFNMPDESAAKNGVTVPWQ